MPLRFSLGSDEKLAMRAFWQFYQARRPVIIEDFGRTLASGTPEIQSELARTLSVENSQHQLELQQAAVLEDQWEPYLEEMRTLGSTYAQAGIGYSAWMWRTAAFREAVRRQLALMVRERHEAGLVEASFVLDGLLRLVDVTLENLLAGYVAAKEEMVDRSEERYRAMFEHSPTPTWTYDRETLQFLDVNQAATRHYGYSREEFLAMRLTDIRPAEDVPALLDDVATTRRTTSSTGIWRHRKKDGSIISVEIAATDLVMGGRRTRLVVANDVTERERAQRALRETEEQLRQAQKMEAVGRLAGGVAHDFNNVLSVIVIGSATLLDALPAGDPLREIVADMRSAGQRGADLTRQLLVFSRTHVPESRVVDVNALLGDLLRMLQRLIGVQIELELVRGAAPGFANVDPSLFEQAVINLVVNARDAMPDGGRLTIATRNVDGHVVLAVRDTGHGMDDETRSKIFEPFFTTKSPDRGTGLGLPMVFSFVQQSGGRIEVHSVVGRGSTFEIFLPACEAPAATSDHSSSSPAVAIAGGTETILLVDDEDVVRRAARRILVARGYTVLEARDGSDALAISEQHAGRIHLVITDAAMPGIDGRELVTRLAQARPGVGVLFMSGNVDEAGGIPSGVAFLQKPFDPAELVRRVRELIDATEA